MGHFDLGNKKSANVNINLISFVDLMTCLTAFLLVSAAWTSQAQIQADINREQDHLEVEPPCKLSVLVARTGLYVATTGGDRITLRPTNWSGLEKTLRTDHGAGCGVPEGVEIAGTASVDYDRIVRALDAARAAGYVHIMVKSPEALAAVFRH